MSRIPARRSERLFVPVVLWGEDIKKLHAALTKFGDSVTYEIECADHLTRELDFKKLIEYENPPSKAIRSLKVHARKKDEFDRYATITIADELFSTVDLSFNGPESEVEKLNDAIGDILAGMRPWYRWLTRFSFFIGLGVFCFLLWCLGLVGEAILRYRGQAGNAKGEMFSWSTSVAIALLACIIASALDKSKNYVFPRVTFAIGQGDRRYRNRDSVRWVIVFGLLVGILASVIAGFISPK